MRLAADRLAELRRALILESAPERTFDDITRLLATTLQVPIAMVNLLDAERDGFKSRAGLEHTQSPALTSFCEAFFSSSSDLIVAENAQEDGRFSSPPLVLGPPYIRFYAAPRLVVHGHTLGTLCAYDVRPRKLSVAQLEDLQIIAAAAFGLISRRRDLAA